MAILISLIIFFSAVIIHEYCHGWVAYKLGDPTAKYAGRLTLNPIEHIDPVGTVLLPIMLIIIKSPVIFGWAKPVPVNFWNLRNPRRDMIWVGLAGPLANFLMAVVFSRLLHLPIPEFFREIALSAVMINLVFAVFNLMPIPPLDGSRVVSGLLPYNYARAYNEFERYGVMVIFLLLFMGFFDRVVWPLVAVLASLLGV